MSIMTTINVRSVAFDVNTTVNNNDTISYQTAENRNIGAAVGVPLSLVAIVIIVALTLAILYKKGIWSPHSSLECFRRGIQRIAPHSIDITTKTEGFKTNTERRRAYQVDICEVGASGTPDALCESIDEGYVDENTISYTLADESQYDELNKSAQRRIPQDDPAENYGHLNRLPPDLENDYDRADANKLFPLRNAVDRPVSDSYNTYSHMVDIKTAETSNDHTDEHMYVKESANQNVEFENESDNVAQFVSNNDNNTDFAKDVDGNSDGKENRDAECGNDVMSGSDDGDEDDDDIYDTEMNDIILSRTQQK